MKDNVIQAHRVAFRSFGIPLAHVRTSAAAIKELEHELRDRFGKFGNEVRALLLVTEIRVRAEQKGLLSVETDSGRLKCLRNSGQRDDFIQFHSRFPRLTAPTPLARLKELIVFLQNLPNP